MRPGGCRVDKKADKVRAKACARSAAFDDILDVGNVGFHVVTIVFVQRHPPHFLTSVLPRRGNCTGKAVIAREKAGIFVVQSSDDGSGQRGNIDQAGRFAGANDIFIGVGKHEPAFGISVEDLDRLAAHRANDIAGPLGVAAGHVFSQCRNRDHVNRGL